MKNKKGFEFSFSWLFALMVGAVILFLAIYAATRLIKTEMNIQNTELGKELGILFNPLETGVESARTSHIRVPAETRIFNECVARGTFGLQRLSVASRSEVGDAWGKPGEALSFSQKYIFSSSVIENQEFLVFSKPLEMPFKVADLLYLWPASETYCFVNPAREVEEELEDLKIPGVNISSSAASCEKGSILVCFTSSGCDVDVSLDASGKIRGSMKKKNMERVYFETAALFYAALFSESSLYECQLKRLMGRTSELASLYAAKSRFLTPKGCSSGLDADLVVYANSTLHFDHSLSLRETIALSDNLRRNHENLVCPLF